MRLVFIFLLSIPAFCANAVYLTDAASGGNTGADCANAKAASYFNSSGNWSATPTGIQIGPDTTIHLCGTFTGTLNSNKLSFQGSGSSGHPVTLLFESGAVMTSPAWGTYNSAGAITATGVSDVTINGANTGTITATANGTSLANQVSSIGIFVSTCTRCTVQNLTISNMYVPVLNNAGNTSSSTGIMTGTGNATLLISGNTIHDAYYCTFSVMNGDTNIEVRNNTVSHCNWGIGAGIASASGTASGILIHDNDISDGGIWEDPADNNHHNGVYVFAEQTSSTVTGLQIYNNYIHGDWQLHVTAWIFMSCQTGTLPSPLVYNNLMTSSVVGSIPANGFIMAWVTGNPQIYNNTIVGSTTSGGNGIQVTAGQGTVTGTVKNNIISTVASGMYIPGATLAASDRNDIYNLSGNAMINGATFYGSLAAWVSGTGFDTNSTSSNPTLNSNGTLQSGSPAIGLGANLTSVGVTALDSDKAGVARPAVAAWDAGALQFQSPSTASGVCSGTMCSAFK